MRSGHRSAGFITVCATNDGAVDGLAWCSQIDRAQAVVAAAPCIRIGRIIVISGGHRDDTV